MDKKPFIAQTSMVPVLACIAALLFSANFYQFLQKNFKKWWGWDFTCPIEQVDCERYERHEMHEHRKHRRHHRHHKHRRHHRHRHEVQDQQTLILDLKRQDMDRAQRDLRMAQRNLQRNLERAQRELERVHERMEWDATADVDRERLKMEIRIKEQNLRALERVFRDFENRAAQQHLSGEQANQEFDFHFEFDFDDNLEVHVREH